MTLSLANLTFDCRNAVDLATFWSQALDRPIDEGASEFFASIGAKEGPRPRWLFLQVPEGKTAKNRCHVDLEADDVPAEIERLVALGATHVADKDEWGLQWTVMSDPESNEFCIAGPHD